MSAQSTPRQLSVAELLRLFDAAAKVVTRHDYRPASIWRAYYPSATGDWVEINELRAAIAKAAR